MEEIWKDIPDYEGLYQVSNLGKVKSLKRKVTRNDGVVQLIREKILKKTLSKDGYYVQSLSLNGEHIKYKIHQLVAMAFLNHKPNGFKLVVDHIDNDKLNNRVDNLQIITNRENIIKSKKNKTGFTGISYRKDVNKYQAKIRLKNKRLYLGYFETAEEASNAYQRELSKIMNLQ